MLAWQVSHPGPLATRPLTRVERDVPEPVDGELRVRISACAVCRTDLHVTEGDLPVHRSPVIPGHEIVGYVDRVGAGCHRIHRR